VEKPPTTSASSTSSSATPATATSASESPGDSTATRSAILKVVDADKPPLRIFFGKAPIDVATKDYESRLATWNEWQPVSIEAYGR
jgi:hypothetical protein